MSASRCRHRASRAVSLFLPLLASASAAIAAEPSTQFSLTGAIARPSVYTLATLQALPAVTQTVTYTAAGVSQTRTYTGTSLWGLIDGAGIVTNPPPPTTC